MVAALLRDRPEKERGMVLWEHLDISVADPAASVRPCIQLQQLTHPAGHRCIRDSSGTDVQHIWLLDTTEHYIISREVEVKERMGVWQSDCVHDNVL